MRAFLPFALVLLLCHSTRALAHDFWIEASEFNPAPKATITLRLRVGQRFRGDPVPRSDARIERFVITGPTGERAIRGRDGADPAGSALCDEAGVYVVGYRSRRSSVELESEKFTAYLKEEGLDTIVEERARRGETGKSGKEVYSRCAKAILRVGTAGVAPKERSGFDRALGLALELVPNADPTTLSIGGTLPLRLLHDGRPLVGALVTAFPHDEPGAPRQGRSDAEGAVRFVIDRPGLWLVKAVHMQPAPAATGAEWESLWASLTFEIQAKKAGD